MSEQESTSGHCLCGAVQWRARGPANWQGNCHCQSCRRANAAPFVGYIAFPNSMLEIEGPLVCHASSPGVERGFCATCHTPVFYRAQRWPKETHLMAATLDDPDQFRPQADFHTEEALSDAALGKDLPRYATTAGENQP